MAPPSPSGEPLILPNLKLKVLIEAIRMVLEIVYDEKFVTFSYGGRVGMGRHTAIRYLKHNVTNPSWWFNVSFCPNKFDEFNVVRYLDEILVITSGSKMLTRELKDWVLDFLEGNLGLKVDRVKTAIHSAVPVKISFLRMEQRAIPPSVLRPPMSENAIRAWKKYLRQKEVRSLELRNARERNRKKLGMKILSHVFKKLKRSNNGFKFEFQIENEVREIFRTWADEIVQEFLGSLEERWNWHRLFSRGDFLSLRHVRDQLPQDLVDAYDKFQEQVDKHLTPIKGRRALEEEEKRVREEEQKYSERTVDDLTKLCMKVSAPIELVRKAVRMAGCTNNMDRPRPISLLFALEDADIVKCTDTIMYRVRSLQNHLNMNPLDEAHWVKGMGTIHETLNQKCLPLCANQINEIYMGKITLQDIDCTSFVEVD
ncbi:hypothetical protein CRYUN_Cryun05aG0106000 [Craigia yunnanensis]